MERALFSDDNAWRGGWYELALELGPRDDERLNAAFVAIWEHPSVEGCYERCDREPEDQFRVAPSFWRARHDLHGRCYGIAALPRGINIPCVSLPVLASSPDDSDWLSLGLPMGGLSTVLPDAAGWPAGENRPNLWRYELNDWLAQIGMKVASVVPYRLGVIGYEVSGSTGLNDAETFRRDGPPVSRRVAYLIPTSDGVDYRRAQ